MTEKRGEKRKGASSEENNSDYLTFSFKFMEKRKKSDYSISKYKKNGKVMADVLETILELSQMTWGDAKNTHRGGMGYEPMPKRDRKRGPNLPEGVSEDVELIVFRTGIKGRMVGFRDGPVFHVLWLDPNHDFY